MTGQEDEARLLATSGEKAEAIVSEGPLTRDG